jgi:hypothetical protein
LADLQAAVDAYAKRFGIEEMFRDFKGGGYNLEKTNLTGDRSKAQKEVFITFHLWVMKTA